MNDPQTEAFFNQIYNQYYRIVFAYVVAHINQRDIAMDLLQDVFVKVWNHIHVAMELGLADSRHWIYRITKNIVIDYYRKRATQQRTTMKLESEAKVGVGHSRSAAIQVEQKDTQAHIEQVIRKLPEDLYMVMTLKLVGEMNSSEIGELLHMPAATVRYKLSKAREAIRKELDQYGWEMR